MRETFGDRIIDEMHRSGEYGFYSENEDFNQEVVGPWKNFTPKYRKFVDQEVYSKDEVRNDVAYVKRMKENFQISRQEAGLLGKTEEAVSAEPVIMEGLGSYDWWGDNVTIVPATKYDDIVNGVDMVAAFQLDDGQVIHLAIDTTADNSKMTFASKFKKDIDRLEKNKLTQVKYYDNPDLEELGAIEMPRVVLGIDKDTITDLQGRMVSKDRTLAKASIGRTLLKEAQIQLVYALDYLLSRSSAPGYKEMTTTEELFQYISKHEEEIDEKMKDIITKYKDVLVVINENIKKSSLGKESQDEYLPDIISHDHLRQIESSKTNGRFYLKAA